MTIEETGKEGGEKNDFLESQGGLDHPTLVAEMKRNDKQPIEQRVLMAKQNREVQLKVYEKWLREQGGGEGAKETNTLRFPQEVHLMDAAVKGAAEDLKELLKGGMDPNTSNQDGLTALHQCCIDGQDEMVELLLSHGASVNATDRDGWTPLHAAATCGHFSIAKRLVEEGADLLAVNGDGDMPFDITEDEKTLQFIEDSMTGKGISHDMVTKKREELHERILEDVQSLIEQGHSLDIPVNAEGATLLHVAIVNEHNDVVKLLLDNGASDANEDVEGWRPIHAAAFWGNKEAVELLIEKRDTNLRAETDNGQMPFDMSDDDDIRKIILNAINKNPGRYSLASATEGGKRKDSSSSDASSRGSADGVEDTSSGTIKFVPGKTAPEEHVASAKERENTHSSSSSDSEKRDDDRVEEIVLPTLRRVESVSTKRNSMREAKKQAPMIRYSQINKLDAPEAYDDSYELMLTKSKKDVPKKQPEVIAKEGTSASAGTEDQHMEATREEAEDSYINKVNANESVLKISSSPITVRKSFTSRSSSSSSSSTDDVFERKNEPPEVVSGDPPSYQDVPLHDTLKDVSGEAPHPSQDHFSPPLYLNREETPEELRRMSSSSSPPPTPAPRTMFGNITYIQPIKSATSIKPQTAFKPPPVQLSAVIASPTTVIKQQEIAKTIVVERKSSASSDQQPSTSIRPVETGLAGTIPEQSPHYDLSVDSRRSSTSSSSSSSLSPSYDYPAEATQQKRRGEKEKSTTLDAVKPFSAAITVYPKETPSNSHTAMASSSMIDVSTPPSHAITVYPKETSGSSSVVTPSSSTNRDEALQPQKGKQAVPQTVEQPPRAEAPAKKEKQAVPQLVEQPPQAEPPPKKFAVLRDTVRQPQATGASPKKGTLQDLKLKRQKSRMAQMELGDRDATDAFSYGSITGQGSSSLGGRREVFKAPDSPTRIRHVFKQPEFVIEKNIFTRERCTIA